MGYTTDFIGGFGFSSTPSEYITKYINLFSETRHYKRNIEDINKFCNDNKNKPKILNKHTFFGNSGILGEFFVDKEGYFFNRENLPATETSNIGCEDYNTPPDGVPGLWCDWKINGNQLVWDGAEKFYEYEDWFMFLSKNFFAFKNLFLKGAIIYHGEDDSDKGVLISYYEGATQFFKNVEYEHLSKKQKAFIDESFGNYHEGIQVNEHFGYELVHPNSVLSFDNFK